MALGAESRSILSASSAEEWNVQKLVSDSGNPCRDSGFSDELRCQILQCTSRYTHKNQNNKTKIKLQPNKNVLFRDMTELFDN